jgi:dTDP-4-amino-4,6-dideoxygalactose transaminase
MYTSGTFYCLSFHYKKHLPIGRGGMILTNDKKAVEWLKMARFDGRREIPLSEDNATIRGWNMYLTPEQAARGLVLFDLIKDKKLPDLKVEDQRYPDLSKWRVFQ